MAIIDPATGARLVFILGITNIIGLLLVVFSCRCMLGLRGGLGQSRRYMRFYRYHCYYWWLFIISVLLHSLVAIGVYGVPS